MPLVDVVVATTKVGIFKQITTRQSIKTGQRGCCCYHKGRNFQANHNRSYKQVMQDIVVVATTKVGIFKQITTLQHHQTIKEKLLLLPQR